MQKSFFLRVLLLPFLLVVVMVATGQPPRGSLVISPQVNADKTVTFRYLATAAKEVKISGQFLKEPQSLVKDNQGIWSITTGPVSPDIYPYSFLVDGITVMDPANEDFFPNERFKASLVDVPADTPLIHAMKDVPHGSVNYEYYSSVEGTTGSVVIYTPPGYDKEAAKKYPVFYLISGTTDTEETFFKVGHANLIADNLIAGKLAKPMIVVMPYSNVRPKPMPDFTKDVMNDIIPFVEASYPVLTNSNNRAVAGFSVGGGQTLNIGLTNTDKFSYICSYAPYTATEEFQKNFTNWNPDAATINKQLKLFTISVGTEDFLYESVKKQPGYVQ